MATRAKKAPAFEVRDRKFRLTENRHPRTAFIKNGSNGKLVTPGEDGLPRAIRHAPNEKSIYIEEQSSHAVIEDIVFEQGYLDVPKENIMTQKFLLASPQFNTFFEEVNEEKEAADALALEDLKVDLKSMLKEKSKEKDGLVNLIPVAASILGSTADAEAMTISQLRQVISNEIDNRPGRFVDNDGNMVLFDEATKRRYIAMKCEAENVIRFEANSSSWIWTHNGNKFLSVPNGIKPIEKLVEHLNTSEGSQLAAEFVKALAE